ncbi:MAG: serine protease [Phenylobacterium sp.]|jgi:serine protease
MFKYALTALATTAALSASVLATSVQAAPAFTGKNVNTNPNPMVIADTVSQIRTLAPLTSVAGGDSSNQMKVKQAGAVFIKVHFSYFNLPQGAYVTVSDLSGNESYRYDGSDHQKATYNTASGENGLTQFSAMSVFGDTAVVRLVMPEGSVWQKQHGIKVDRFHAGSSDEMLANKGMEQSIVSEQFSTCGVNERTDVACWQSSHPTEYERTRPVARLLMAGSGLCTGWRVGNDNHMFTNNHCLDNASTLQDTEVWFNYQADACNGSVNNATVIKVTGKDLLKTDYDLDYSLFTVNGFANIASFGNFGLHTAAPTLGELIYIPQHGSGNPKELSIDSDQNANGKCQIDVASATGRAAGTDTGYFCDTIGGSSGSPVLASSDNKVVALHHFGGCENQGVRIDKIWPQVSTYFGGVVPDGDGGSPTPQPPVAQATVSCTNLSCSFDGTGSSDVDGSIVSYAWSLGDSTTANGATASHSYGSAGSYTVSLTVTDNDGSTNTQSQTVAVADGNSTGELQSGVAVTGLADVKDGEADYYINTTDNNSTVVVTISGGSGDADLYVKNGGVPSKSSYDCRPYKAGNSETCTVQVGTPGTVNVKLIAYSAYDGVSLLATATTVTDPGNDFPQTGISGATGDWARYTYTVPAGVSSVTVTTSGGTGDADLYTRNGAEPTTSDYDCRPYAGGNSENCTATVTSGDVVHIGLRAYSAFSGVTLDVN